MNITHYVEIVINERATDLGPLNAQSFEYVDITAKFSPTYLCINVYTSSGKFILTKAQLAIKESMSCIEMSMCLLCMNKGIRLLGLAQVYSDRLKL